MNPAFDPARQTADQSATASSSGPLPQAGALRRLAAIVECSPDALVACDPDGSVQTWNAGATQLFGVSSGQIMGRRLSTLIAPTHQPEFELRYKRANEGLPSGWFSTIGRRLEGGLFELTSSLTPMALSGPASGVCLVAREGPRGIKADDSGAQARDELIQREAALREALSALRISHEELKQTQLQLIQSAKLESVGRLAAGVAHEVKNPLAIILAGAEYLQTLSPLAAAPASAVLQDILTGVHRANRVVGGLLNYSASTEISSAESDINAVIDQSLLLVQHALKSSHLRVQRELAPDLPTISLDVTKMEQVFINLLMNAIHATPQGGIITVRTVRKQLTARDEAVGFRRTDALRVGESVVLASIEDTGSGIPAEHLPKLFDPFFTTKPTGKGTGLGLAVSKTIVALHGGTIWITNRPQGGAIATVVLRSATT